MNGLSGFFPGLHGVDDGFVSLDDIARGEELRVAGLVVVRFHDVALYLNTSKGL